MNPAAHPAFGFLSKRLLTWEFIVGLAALGLFWFIAFIKGYELAAVTVVGLGILVTCIAYPRAALYIIIILVFVESLFGAYNQVATISDNFEIVGYEQTFESAFFYIVIPWIVFAAILGYIISRFLSNPTPFGMLTTEYIMLMPPLLCLTFAPMSFYYDHPNLAITADCLPGLFFVLGIISARVFFPIKGLFYILLNALCIGNHAIGIGYIIYAATTGLMQESPIFLTFVGRILMGPTDFNIFLVPILLGIILYCGKNLPKGWLWFYNFSFWAFFLRLIVALYRGPIAAMFLAIALVYYFSDREKRAGLRKYMMIMLITIAIFVILFMQTPNGGMILKSLFVERFTGIFKTGEAHEGSKLSLNIRVTETEVAWADIMDYPIFGHGPGAEIEYRYMQNMPTEKLAFIHNGYLWLWYKFGIIGPISMILFLLTPFIRGLQLLKKKITNTERAFLVGVISTTICIFPAIVTNSIIARAQGLMMLIFCFIILLTIERRVFRDEGLDINPYL